ncbi:hypothetical protein [Laceyella putida]|uniref:Carboxypeptidase regulatory-like domain-containing protein n=1 Tax=Laceyella putida TaxID=110101 RepID=A0ABW2RFI4_9BACL
MKKWLRGLAVVLVLGAFLSGFAYPSLAGAAGTSSVYWSGSGILHPGESMESGKVLLPSGEKVLKITQIASGRDGEDPWQGSYTIELMNRRGEVVDSCIGDNYNFQTTGMCYFEDLRRGSYSVKITNLSAPEMNVISATLRD